MTKLAALHVLFLITVASLLLAGCGRTDIGAVPPGAGGAPSTGCQSNADCPSGETCDVITHQCVAPSGGCTSDQDCSAPTPHCRMDTHTCVQCVTNSQCPAGEECSDFQCVGFCGSGQACAAGLTCCTPLCVDLTTNLESCGQCGVACGPYPEANPICAGSTCGIGSCLAPFANCDGIVANGCEVDTAVDPGNCGGCGIVCPPGDTCAGGMCQATCNGGPACTGADTCCLAGCVDETNDAKNCGGCGKACPPGDTCVNSACQMPVSCNGGPACPVTETCCLAGCVDESNDPNNCGGCGTMCPPTTSCVSGTCATSEGTFNPTISPTYLAPGVHNFTGINVPAGVTVYVAGAGPASGTLDLHSIGPIVIDGTIDLSGGPGTQNSISSMSTQTGRAGSGGYTGEPNVSAPESSACQFIAGNPGQGGAATPGSAGSCNVLSTITCVGQTDPTALIFTSPVAAYGGGAGVFTGYRAYGSGGGGLAGGAPGALCAPYPGEVDCTGISGGGGAVAGQGGQAGLAVYNGTAGTSGQTQCAGIGANVPPACVGGGGGGSIGTQAAADLAVLTTFQTGSSGGGGSADYLNRPVFGGTSGGGGGGGALRLSTPSTITIGGQLLVNGGLGGDANIGIGSNAGCDPQPGAAGGGGSGGLLYLSAPSITVTAGATLSAAGGTGGAGSEFATGGAGGNGGLGRIRLSVTQATCSLGGSFNPPLAGGCAAAAAQAGRTYIGVYPN